MLTFKGIQLHNVSELEQNSSTEGFYMLRVPKDVENGLNDMAKDRNILNTGVELRFVAVDDEVRITLQIDAENDVSTPMIYYGNIQAGWQESQKVVYNKPTEIVVKKPERLEYLRKIASDFGHSFDPEVIRVVMPAKKCCIIDVVGRCNPPKAEQMPQKRYLAYGSSITHGSLSVLPATSYAFVVAENLKADLINLGYAGSAAMEPCMADYIAERKDWDFATLEMGINVINTMSEEEFENRVRYFVYKIASENPDKTVVCIDMFYFSLDYENNEKADVYRNIVRKVVEELNLANVSYINGKSLLDNMDGLSADLIHPNVRGMQKIAENLTSQLKSLILGE